MDNGGPDEDRLEGSSGQSRRRSESAKSRVDRSRCNKTFEVGDEVILSTCNISVN